MSRDPMHEFPIPRGGWRQEWGKCPATGKRVYLTRRLATKAARLLSARASAYRCPQCDKFHVTHYSRRVQQAISMVLGIEP